MFTITFHHQLFPSSSTHFLSSQPCNSTFMAFLWRVFLSRCVPCSPFVVYFHNWFYTYHDDPIYETLTKPSLSGSLYEENGSARKPPGSRPMFLRFRAPLE